MNECTVTMVVVKEKRQISYGSFHMEIPHDREFLWEKRTGTKQCVYYGINNKVKIVRGSIHGYA